MKTTNQRAVSEVFLVYNELNRQRVHLNASATYDLAYPKKHADGNQFNTCKVYMRYSMPIHEKYEFEVH
jgi:hypothetical protein